MGKSSKSKFVVVLIACVFIGMLPGSTGWGAALPEQDLNDRQFIQPITRSETQEIDHQSASLRFAVIGDYGDADTAEPDVAALVKSWYPDIIVTTGDNNYDDGAAAPIDDNIGQFFHEFIYPYKGSYGSGAEVNRFFPSLGNHDWKTTDSDGLPYPYLDYFTLPGNERYYDFTLGLVHFFILDSDPHEPDGYEWDSVQGDWLKSQLANSIYPWKIVVMHHPPFSSGEHDSASWMQWPFAAWGADVVLAGHDHTYERISPPDGILYFVNGLGGKSIYDFPGDVDGSQLRYNEDYGAMLVDVSIGKIRFQFINRKGEVIDDVDLVKPFTYSYLPLLNKKAP